MNHEQRATRPCCLTGSYDCETIATKDRHGKPLRNVICRASGLIYVDPLPYEDTGAFYKHEYRKEYKGVLQPKPKRVLRAGRAAMVRYASVAPYLEDGAKVLDAGASSGEFVYLMSKLGYQAEGIEPNLGHAQYAIEKLGANIKVGLLSEVEKAPDSFDMITMFHVMEHLENPVDEIAGLAAALKPGGHFVIEVPNIVFPGMQFKTKWHRGHLYGFTVKTLEACAAKANLETVYCREIASGAKLFGVFTKPEKPGKVADVDTLIGGHFAEVKRLIAQNNYATYLTQPYVYRKTFAKAFRFIDENLSTFGKAGAREIIDSVLNR